MTKLTALLAVLATAALLPALAPAKENPGVIRSGKCSGAATWKLKGKNDDGRLEIEFEVDQNIVGRRWTVTLTRDGSRIFRGVRVTRAPSGSFTVARRPVNPAGTDRIVAVARAARGGQVCRGALTV